MENKLTVKLQHPLELRTGDSAKCKSKEFNLRMERCILCASQVVQD